jgi:two-component system, cell cycle response regulator DivK
MGFHSGTLLQSYIFLSVCFYAFYLVGKQIECLLITKTVKKMDTSIKSSSPPTTNQLNQVDWTNKTILIADDVKLNYLVLRAILGKTKANILWAEDGQQALEFCTQNQDIDVVLMDYNMPRLNGYEATKLIKKIRRDLPVISQTTYSMGSHEFDELVSNCDDYVVKPINRKKLLYKIDKLINKKKVLLH